MSESRRVFITGGSGAIGRALAVRFASTGARVAFTYFMGHEGMEATSAAVRDAGGEAVPVQCNLRDKGGPTEAVEGALAALGGGVDVFVSNAATGVLKPLADVSPKSWQGVLQVNAGAFLEMTRQLAPTMEEIGRAHV